MIEAIRDELFRMQDEKYRDFQSKLIPDSKEGIMIGVRTPDLRKYAKSLAKNENVTEFLSDLPHKYFDENQLHAFIISETRDYGECMDQVSSFLPFVDNWATCDQMNPKIFKKHKKDLLIHIKDWIHSEDTYRVRFGIRMLMAHFLDEDFDLAYPRMVAGIRSDEYYVNMMIAWYFATALAKQYGAVIPFLEERKLDVWTHNKTIQKSVESYRISPEEKTYLRGLRIRRK